jgi:hypothetical protein
MIDRHPRIPRLFDMVMTPDGTHIDERRLAYVNAQFFLDLLSWYHLAWLGHSLKQAPAVVQALLDDQEQFDVDARVRLLQVMSPMPSTACWGATDGSPRAGRSSSR